MLRPQVVRQPSGQSKTGRPASCPTYRRSNRKQLSRSPLRRKMHFEQWRTAIPDHRRSRTAKAAFERDLLFYLRIIFLNSSISAPTSQTDSVRLYLTLPLWQVFHCTQMDRIPSRSDTQRLPSLSGQHIPSESRSSRACSVRPQGRWLNQHRDYTDGISGIPLCHFEV